ncbi:F-box-like/WD repeat-containing protein TBL1XR1-A [Wickerhamiella sorbophila]|uniref:F-box-like/WD repeat-containing protein TBL1XR1-A n=1 Tax=Wickerhamiella sorbophila TaxID=45607 RepID=A0A2T0FDE6_9ASCO|nr:F-box-like/WD repeat-containing protein TBL1XR1-A [Wickerhamiella sorbophila]PRT52990.1 F-box-like/WD repeat-containing protein TBL1XR1-A [Wickerhamiella sorbophila]
MHLSSQEVNYLIWRYFQEEGLELSGHALDREISASSGQGALVESYERGDLVRLLLRGLQLTEVELAAAKAVEENRNDTEQAEKPMDGITPATTVSEAVKPPAKSTDGLEPTKTLPAGSAVSFGGDLLALGTKDKDALILLPSGTELALKYASRASPDAHATAVAWTPTNEVVAVGTFSGSIRLWTADGALLKALPSSHSAPIVSLKFNPDGSSLASVDVTGGVSIWDIGEGIAKYTSERPEGQMLVEVEWIDELTLASTHPDGVPLGGVAIYKIGESLPTVRFRGHIRAVTILAFDKLSQLLASGGDDYVVNLWHARTPTPVRTLTHHRGPITALNWLPGPLGLALDGSKIASMLITGSADGSVGLWDLDATPPSLKWEIDFESAVTLVETNSTNNLIAVAGSDSVNIYTISPTECSLVGKCAYPGALSLAWHDRTLAIATNSTTVLFSV